MRTSLVWFGLVCSYGCSDAGVTKFNSTPTANITSHNDGDSVREGYSETLRGTVGDPNHAIDQLRVTWLVDGVEACTESLADNTGVVLCSTAFLPDGGHVILEVRDPEGASATATRELQVSPTDAPLAQILAPSDAQRQYADQPTTLHGAVSDGEDAPTDLTVQWESSLDGPLTGTFNFADSAGDVVGATSLTEGEHFLTLTVTDTTGKVGRDSVQITVGPANSVPTCTLVAPLDGAVLPSGTTVTLEGRVADVDQDTASLDVVWQSDVDGTLDHANADTDGTIESSVGPLAVGDHRLSLVVTDEIGETCTAAVRVTVGMPPSVTWNIPTDGSIVNEQEAVNFDVYIADNEDPPAAVWVEWTSDLDGSLWTGNATSTGTTPFSRDDLQAGVHRLTVTATDTSGQTGSANATLTVNARPTAPTVTLSPAPALTDDNLAATASGSVDPDSSGAITYSYSWFDDGVAIPAYSTNTLPAAATTKHHTYKVVVTPFDGTGDGPTGEADVTIQNSAPILTTPTLSPPSPSRADTLTCAATASDADPADTPSVTYRWSDGSTGPSLSLAAFSAGDALTCTVTADDADGGIDTASVSTTIGNAAPTITALALAPLTAYTDDTLTATALTSDADGDILTLIWEWSVNGVVVQSGPDNTLDGTLYFEKNDSVTVFLTADDGTDSTQATSAAITIQNTVPTAPIVTIDPSLPLPEDELWCEVTAASIDADGDTVTYQMSWDVDGTPWASPSTTTWTDDAIAAATTQTKETWTCTATPNDGDSDGPTASDAVVPCPAVLELNGGADIVNLPTVSTLTGAITLEAWVNLDAPPATSVQLMGTTCGGIGITPTEVNVGLIDNCAGTSGGCKSGWNNVSTWVASNNPSGDGGFLYTGWDGTWKHLAVTVDTSHVARLFIDGTLHSAKTLSRDGCISSTVTGALGRAPSSSTAMDGQIGAVRMSTGLLYSSTFTPAYPLTSSSSTVLLYGLQGDMDSSTLTDETGNGHTATVTRATWTTGGPDCE